MLIVFTTTVSSLKKIVFKTKTKLGFNSLINALEFIGHLVSFGHVHKESKKVKNKRGIIFVV